jgi:hypothetical protein
MALFTFITPKILVQTTNPSKAFFNEPATRLLMERAVWIGATGWAKVHKSWNLCNTKTSQV